jgi:hypothetical protein
MKQKYLDRDIRFQCKTVAKINRANVILNEYKAQGFIMTVRQLYYQFVARGLLENTFNNYKRLTVNIDDARVAGLIDWDLIEDRSRSRKTHPSWNSPEDIIRDDAVQYAEDIWQGQRYRPEVWIEKAALLGVIEPICTEYRVPYFATIGNNSQSDMREAGERFKDHITNGPIPLVLHLADHDPNGIDMTRDIRKRLSMFAGKAIEVRRIALNMDQVAQYRPPPRSRKIGLGSKRRLGHDHHINLKERTKMTEISIRHESTPEEKIKTEKLLDALKAVIQTADPEKRRALTETVVLFADWPLSRTPALLNEIMLVIGAHPDTKWP